MAPSARFPNGAEELVVLTVPTAGPAGPVQEKTSIPRWMSEAMKKYVTWAPCRTVLKFCTAQVLAPSGVYEATSSNVHRPFWSMW